ncbi:DUF190 domain-containing protein [Thermodesulfobacterium hveragerdense]|uniref:DUF190 domain-containing protein n=1 Tax=Thermodesulfobacterium hveragerdense TaxID=53424 RepID=UPI00048C8F7F|nr:DUF190 domain-containing protein [Thermodesulfobacterium hveragerdense]
MPHTLVRIYLTENDEALFLKLLFALKKEGIAGATILKGICGYGRTGAHYKGVEVLSYSFPVILEIVEEENKVLEVLDGMKDILKGRFITLEKVEIC